MRLKVLVKHPIMQFFIALPFLYLYLVTWQSIFTVGALVLEGRWSNILSQLFQGLNPVFALGAGLYAFPNYVFGCYLSLVFFFIIGQRYSERIKTRKQLYGVFALGIVLFQVPMAVWAVLLEYQRYITSAIFYIIGSVIFMAYFIPFYQRIFRHRGNLRRTKVNDMIE